MLKSVGEGMEKLQAADEEVEMLQATDEGVGMLKGVDRISGVHRNRRDEREKGNLGSGQ